MGHKSATVIFSIFVAMTTYEYVFAQPNLPIETIAEAKEEKTNYVPNHLCDYKAFDGRTVADFSPQISVNDFSSLEQRIIAFGASLRNCANYLPEKKSTQNDRTNIVEIYGAFVDTEGAESYSFTTGFGYQHFPRNNYLDHFFYQPIVRVGVEGFDNGSTQFVWGGEFTIGSQYTFPDKRSRLDIHGTIDYYEREIVTPDSFGFSQDSELVSLRGNIAFDTDLPSWITKDNYFGRVQLQYIPSVFFAESQDTETHRVSISYRPAATADDFKHKFELSYVTGSNDLDGILLSYNRRFKNRWLSFLRGNG